jgi:hypothetical protein
MTDKDPPEELEDGVSSGAVPPQIFRGEPPRAKQAFEKKRLNPWRRNLEIGRQFSGQWVLLSEVSTVGMGCKERTKKINMDRRRVQQWLDKESPLERWQLSVHTKEGTVCTKQLVAKYLRTLTEEEDRLDRIERRKRYIAMMQHREEKARERELTARLQRRPRGGAQG